MCSQVSGVAPPILGFFGDSLGSSSCLDHAVVMDVRHHAHVARVTNTAGTCIFFEAKTNLGLGGSHNFSSVLGVRGPGR